MSLRAGGGDAPLAEPQNLIEAEFFQQLLHLETQKALRLRYSISVLCVSVSEIPQRHDPSLTRNVAKAMIRRLRATDIATVLSPSAVGILLVDTKIESLRQVFDRATESFREYPVSLETQESRVMLRAGAVCFPGTATKASDLLSQAMAFMGRASHEETISLHLPD
jgi:PleD family two-component response regulator